MSERDDIIDILDSYGIVPTRAIADRILENRARGVSGPPDFYRENMDSLTRAQEAIAAARNLHRPCDDPDAADYCRECSTGLSPVRWPCPTVQALRPGLIETIHACPPDDLGLTPCCGQTPFELPRTDRITLDPNLVTCHGSDERA